MKSRRTSILLFFAAIVFDGYTAFLPGRFADASLYFGHPVQWVRAVHELHTLHFVLFLTLPLVMLVEWIRYTCQKVMTWRTVSLTFIVWFLATILLQVIQHVPMKMEEYSMITRDQSLQQWILPNTIQITAAFAGYSALAQIPLVFVILLTAKMARALKNRAIPAIPAFS